MPKSLSSVVNECGSDHKQFATIGPILSGRRLCPVPSVFTDLSVWQTYCIWHQLQRNLRMHQPREQDAANKSLSHLHAVCAETERDWGTSNSRMAASPFAYD